jgi:hypothetical protein
VHGLAKHTGWMSVSLRANSNPRHGPVKRSSTPETCLYTLSFPQADNLQMMRRARLRRLLLEHLRVTPWSSSLANISLRWGEESRRSAKFTCGETARHSRRQATDTCSSNSQMCSGAVKTSAAKYLGYMRGLAAFEFSFFCFKRSPLAELSQKATQVYAEVHPSHTVDVTQRQPTILNMLFLNCDTLSTQRSGRYFGGQLENAHSGPPETRSAFRRTGSSGVAGGQKTEC